MRLAVMASAAAFVPMCLSVSPLATPLGAQAGVAPACDIQGSISKEVATPWFNFTRAQSAPTIEAKRISLKAVMKDLGEKPERYAKNPVGYNYVMSQALSLWLMDPTIGVMTTRGAIGFTTTPEQPYDLIAHIDSSFNAIVAASPNCAQDVARERQASGGWLAIVRKALEASNNGAMDSAVYYANLSLRLSKDSPYPYYVLASADNSKQNYKGAIANWTKLVEVAGQDTSYKDIRISSYFYLGMRQLEVASAESGAEQKATAKSAANWLRLYMTESPASSDLPSVMGSLADALQLSGDSLALPSVYKKVLADPSPYDDFALTMAGVIATRANDQESAVKLFQAAVVKNPQSRDAQRNLSATFYARKEFDKMWAPLKALVQLDPNNSDAWLMHAYAAQGLMNAAKTPAEKKTWTDTLVSYSNFADNLPAKVDITTFQRSKDGATVSIAVEQQAAAPGNYTVTMEFLDAKGAVVATDEKKMGPIAKGDRKKETFKTTNATVMSFRYKPLK